MARLKIVPLSRAIAQEWFTTGHELRVRCEQGLPEGAELVNTYYDEMHMQVCLVFHHPSFPDLPYGSIYPPVDVEYVYLEPGTRS